MATFQPCGPEHYQPAHRLAFKSLAVLMGFVRSPAGRAQPLVHADTVAKEQPCGRSGWGWMRGRSHKVPPAYWEAQRTFIPFGK